MGKFNDTHMICNFAAVNFNTFMDMIEGILTDDQAKQLEDNIIQSIGIDIKYQAVMQIQRIAANAGISGHIIVSKELHDAINRRK